jgi:hypothetical protein
MDNKKPVWKKWWFWAIVVIVIIGALRSCGDDETTTEDTNDKTTQTDTKTPPEGTKNEKQPAKEKQEKPVELTPQQKMLKDIQNLIDSKQAFDTGSYIQGDIPAGEYAFVRFKGSGQYYVEKDQTDKIIDNENFDSFGYVQVHGAGNLQTKGVLINIAAFPQLGVTGAKDIYEKLNNVQNFQEAGYYKVGVDIPAGTYTIESVGKGYMAIMTGPVGNSDIVDNENFNGRYSVSVSDGQYLKLSRAKISQ